MFPFLDVGVRWEILTNLSVVKGLLLDRDQDRNTRNSSD